MYIVSALSCLPMCEYNTAKASNRIGFDLGSVPSNLLSTALTTAGRLYNLGGHVFTFFKKP